MDPASSERPEIRFAARAFAGLCAIWLAARFLPAPLDPPPAVFAWVAAVRVFPSPATGRFELSVPERARAVPSAATIEVLRARLESDVDAVNADLVRLGTRSVVRIELFPDDGVTGIRLAGTLIPFYDQDATRLAAAHRTIADRPWNALREIAEVLDGRLSEPQVGFLLEDSAKQRELMRFHREIADALTDAESATAVALDTFRADATRAAIEGGGPFRRRGRGRILEIVLAALLGTTLAAALRPGPRKTAPDVALFFSPVFATSVVLLAEGSAFLPVDPVFGTSRAFLPLAFGLGFTGSWFLAVATRFPRLVSEGERDDRSAAARPSEAIPSPAQGSIARRVTPPAAAGALPPAPEPPPDSAPKPEPPRPAPRADTELPDTTPRTSSPRDEKRFPRSPEAARLPFFPKRKSSD